MTDTNYCNGPDSIPITMRVAPKVKAAFVTDPDGCVPHLAIFNNISDAGQFFYWEFGDGGTSTEFAPEYLYTRPGIFTVKLKVEDTMTCNKVDSATFTINVHDGPTARFTFSPVTPRKILRYRLPILRLMLSVIFGSLGMGTLQ